MIPFDFQLRTRFVFGPGSFQRLGELAGELGARRALLVSDPGIVACGHAGRGLELLQRAGIDAQLFQEFSDNPSTDDVDRGLRFARRHEPELIIGLGGGSSMDCAKGINFLYTNGGQIKDYWGVGKALKAMLPMIAVPTTSGTGSEAQSFALISDAVTHAKMACGDKKASCRIAVLDPELTLTQPARVTALTGIDAISHAVESYVTKSRNDISMLYSREAWRRLARAFPRVLEHPDDLVARGEMQLGACLAGLAIENSMLGVAHSLANPLTAHYGIAHGQAVAVMLPQVVRYNRPQAAASYADLFDDLRLDAQITSERREAEDKATLLADHLQALTRSAGLATHLESLGVAEDALPMLADEAARQWTATFNPRDTNAGDLRQLYEAAFRGPSGS